MHLGLFAVDLKDAFPDLCVVNGDNTEMTDEDTIQPQHINGEYTMLLLKGIQELNTKLNEQIEQLTNRIIALENR